MTKSKQHSSHVENIIIATILIGSLLFATGVVVANYFPIKSSDIFVVEPLSTVSTMSPQQEPSTQIQEMTEPELEESSVDNHPTTDAETPIETESKPGFIEQSMIGWKIIGKAIVSPFTK